MYLIKPIGPDQLTRARELATSRLAGIWLNIHGAHLHISSNDDEIIGRVREGYAFFEQTKEQAQELGHWFHLVILSRDAADYQIHGAAILETDSLPLYCIIAIDYGRVYCISTYYVLNFLTGIFFTAEMVARLYDRFLVIHGAGVAADGVGVIFPAALRSGKTTLALSFIYQGFKFSSDDIILVDRQSIRIYPYPRLFGLRQESLYIVPGIHQDYRKLHPSSIFGEPRWFLNKIEAVSEPFECKCIAFPKLRKDFTRLEKMSRADAALQLIKNAFYPATPTRCDANVADNLTTIRRLLDNAECYTLYHWDPRESIPLLAQAVWRTELTVG